jgi:hypothetical protein
MPETPIESIIPLRRLASEPILTGTDQGTEFAYFILPPGIIPEPTTLYTPHRNGLKRYLGNLADLNTDCDTGPPPETDPKDPVIKGSYEPPGFVIGETYNLILDTANYGDVVTIGTGTTINHFEFSAYPGWLSVTNVFGEPTKTRLTGVVPTGTTTIPVTITVFANEPSGIPHSDSASYIVEPKVVVDPYMGTAYAADKVRTFYVGPDSDTAPWLTITTAPAGFLNRARTQMTEWDTLPLAILGNKPGAFRRLLTDPPLGLYAGTLEHVGKVLYWTYTETGTVSAQAITLSDTAPDPGGGGTIAKPTVAASDVIQRSAGQSWAELFEYTVGAGQRLKNVVVLGSAPTGFAIRFISDTKPQGEWTVPGDQANGTITVTMRLTQTDDQYVDFTRTFAIASQPYYVRVAPDNSTTTLLLLGAVFTNGTVQIDGPAGWINTGVKPFVKFGATADGLSYAARNRDFYLNTAGQYIFTFVQDGVTRYASLVVPLTGVPAAGVKLELSATKPAQSEAPAYYEKHSATSINEGTIAYTALWQHVAGQTDTPVSGVEYVGFNARTGTTVGRTTGQIKVDANATQGDSYVLQLIYMLNGINVKTSTIQINDTSTTPLITPVRVDYVWTNAGHSLDVFVKTNSGLGTLEWSYEITGPGGYETPGPGGNQSGSVAFMPLTVGDYTNGYSLKGTKLSLPLDSTYGLSMNIWIRRVGTTQTWLIPVPSLPPSGNVARTNIYSTESGIPSNPGGVWTGTLSSSIPPNNPEWIHITITATDLVNGRFKFINDAPEAARFNKVKVDDTWTSDYASRWWPMGVTLIFSVFDPIGSTYAASPNWLPRVYPNDNQYDPVFNDHTFIHVN